MKSLKILIVSISMILLAGCGESEEEIHRQKSINIVKHKLKDPSSARFRDVYVKLSEKNIFVTCGEVNSKNSFGGYIGYKRFLSAGKSELTYFEGHANDFDEAWIKYCS